MFIHLEESINMLWLEIWEAEEYLEILTSLMNSY